jgi:hypothetical protein
MRTSDEHFTLLRGPHIVLLLWKGEHDYARVLVVSLVFGFCQVGLSAVVIVAIQIAFTAGTEPRWLDAVILCSLQLFVGTNVSILSTSPRSKAHASNSLPGYFIFSTPLTG